MNAAKGFDVTATGPPTIDGTARVDKILTADISRIADDDGLTEAVYTYQWVRSDGGTDSDISEATGSTYTLVPDDEGGTIKVRVSFTDDEGNPEELTSAATDTVAESNNTAATGAPTISGTAQVGQTLTADTADISDDDGMDGVSYSYQWARSDGDDYTDIDDATGSTYTLVAADEGRTIRVRVSFADDENNAEELTSAETDTVAQGPIWTATMITAPLYVDHGYSDYPGFQYGSLTMNTFAIDGVTYTVKVIEAWGFFYIGFDRQLPVAFTLEVDGTRLESGDARFESYSYGNTYTWQETGLDWDDGQSVDLAMYRGSQGSG